MLSAWHCCGAALAYGTSSKCPQYYLAMRACPPLAWGLLDNGWPLPVWGLLDNGWPTGNKAKAEAHN